MQMLNHQVAPDINNRAAFITRITYSSRYYSRSRKVSRLWCTYVASAVSRNGFIWGD